MGAGRKGCLSPRPPSLAGCIPKGRLAITLQSGPTNLLSSVILLGFIFILLEGFFVLFCFPGEMAKVKGENIYLVGSRKGETPRDLLCTQKTVVEMK